MSMPTVTMPYMNKTKEFTSAMAIEAVAKELSYPSSNLKVDSSWLVAEFDSALRYTTSHQVRSGNSPLSMIVHRDQEAAELVCRRTIGRWLAKGVFFDQMSLDVGVVEAFGRLCDPEDFIPWITAQVRGGWIAEQRAKEDQKSREGGQGVVDTIKGAINSHLPLMLKDLIGAVLKLCHQDPVLAMTVFIEQCRLDEATLTLAIMRSCGGWQEFSCSEIVGHTSEGFLLESDNAYTDEYLRKLYEDRNMAVQQTREGG